MAEEKKEKRKKYMQEYYKKNKAKLKKQALNYYWENRDEIREKFLKKYHKNKNEIKKYQREYYQKNKERILKRRKESFKSMSEEERKDFYKKRSFRKKMRRKYGERAKEMIILEEIKKRMLDGKKEILGRRIITKGDWLRSGGYINIETFAHITGEPVKKIIGLAQKHGFNFTDNVHSAFLLFFDVVAVV